MHRKVLAVLERGSGDRVIYDLENIAIGFVIGAAVAVPFTFRLCASTMKWCLRYATRYRVAFRVMCKQYRKEKNCCGCKYNDDWQHGGCRISPRYLSDIDEHICGAVAKKLVEDRIEKAGIE